VKSAALSVKKVNVAYGGPPVIRDIDLDIQSGEFFGLMGLNGAGKTTLIKSILSLRDPLSGDINIAGGKKNLAYLPERFEPPWFLSGLEFLQFSLKLYKQKFNEDEVMESAHKLALAPDALKRRVETYSKGMRQKLGLLGTVLTNCKLLILDEPMSGLDPMARTLVKDMLVERKSHDQTIFLSSHILADMDEICDRVALLDQGEIKFVGKPADLKKKASTDNLERAFLHFVEGNANV
jgi:ABC-2 type transport system ATP-binding protein